MKKQLKHTTIQGIDKELWQEWRSIVVRKGQTTGERMNQLLQKDVEKYRKELIR